MNITYLGHLAVLLKEKDVSVVFNPFAKSITGFSFKKTDADIVLSSNSSPECSDYSKVPESSYKVTGPGEYEVQEVMMLGYPLMEKSQDSDSVAVNKNTVYRVEIDGVNVCHLGDLKRKLTVSEVNAIGSVDVLILPVGGEPFLSVNDATIMVEKIEPSIVIPVAYYNAEYVGEYENLLPVEKFLESLGTTKPSIESYLKVKLSDFNQEDEGTHVVILEKK